MFIIEKWVQMVKSIKYKHLLWASSLQSSAHISYHHLLIVMGKKVYNISTMHEIREIFIKLQISDKIFMNNKKMRKFSIIFFTSFSYQFSYLKIWNRKYGAVWFLFSRTVFCSQKKKKKKTKN